MNNEPLTIALPSLIHRIGGDVVKRAKISAAEHGCELKRIRRSRNWQAIGQATDIKCWCQWLAREEPETTRFLTTKLETALAANPTMLETTEEKLIKLVLADPNITLANLMEQTNCTLAQARTARFDAEVL